MRNFSAAFRNELESRNPSEVLLVFVTASHPQIASVIRIVSDTVDYLYGGERFYGVPFQFEFLSDGDRAPAGSIVIPDPTGDIGETLRAINAPMRLKIEVIGASEFGDPVNVLDTQTDETRLTRSPLGTPVVQLLANHLRMTGASGGGAGVVQCKVGSFDVSADAYPSRRATPELTPALFY